MYLMLPLVKKMFNKHTQFLKELHGIFILIITSFIVTIKQTEDTDSC